MQFVAKIENREGEGGKVWYGSGRLRLDRYLQSYSCREQGISARYG
jgi:hypothetical protein